MDHSIIDALGVEIIGVMSPVSICMLLVVLLLTSLSPASPSSISPPPITAATLVYLESPSDSSSTKFEGALLNAAVFVLLVTVVTFLLVLLYYYHFTNFLKNYMRFSAFFVLASMGGAILLSLLRQFSIPLDAVTFLLVLFNFAAVGVLSVFSPAVPIILRQSYMVVIAVIVAAWFAKLPEWTTWTLLLALAAYDLVAVLAPRGPLRILVELASSRDDDLPALVYEARPTVAASSSSAAVDVASLGAVELQPVDPEISRGNHHVGIGQNSNLDRAIIEMKDLEEERSPLMMSSGSSGGVGGNAGNSNSDRSVIEMENLEGENSVSNHAVVEIERFAGESSPLVSRGDNRDGNAERRRGRSSQSSPSSEVEMFDTTRGVRLGLGDFVFYSVLVGRAAMYDLMTVYACYLAIISGLGCTLILLSVCRHALPALPISITLGVVFYFLTRLLMEPFVVGTSTNLWIHFQGLWERVELAAFL
ncbi:presenilin-like protein At1g08700 isoform X2 [Typha angustifolia]|uniref:presenilin-like protein At1g08700 isoform X2 n=1 Tax=Typha angustifolia TaxID=59011 RepID=UPI003C2B9DAF